MTEEIDQVRALEFAANVLRTLSSSDADNPEALLYAARQLDKIREGGTS